MEDRSNITTKSHAAHIAPVRRPRGWEQRMRGGSDYPPTARRNEKDITEPQLKAVPPVTQSSVPDDVPEGGCPPCHRGLLVSLLLILGVSIPLIFSASAAEALGGKGGPFYFLWHQVFFIVAGLLIMVGISRLSKPAVKRLAWVLFVVAIVGLVATKWSPFKPSNTEVDRWIKLGPFTFQFSEMAKIALLLVLSIYWSSAAKITHRKTHSRKLPWFISAIALTAPLAFLIFIQPHLSATLILLSLWLIIPFFAGVPGKQYAKIVGGVVLFAVLTFGLAKTHNMPFMKAYQQDRIAHFLSSDKNDQAGNYQTAQGLRAIERGSWLGVGLGNSVFKQGHLPAPHTDFIMAVLGEEGGMVGMLILLALYGCLIHFCLEIGRAADNRFEMLVATGMGLLLFVQVLGNMFVVLGFMPVTGVQLPFISYGGSGLVCLLMGMGFVLGISRHQNRI